MSNKDPKTRGYPNLTPKPFGTPSGIRYCKDSKKEQELTKAETSNNNQVPTHVFKNYHYLCE